MRDLSELRVTTTRTPPPGGLDTVVREARRRVRNRAVASATVTAAATAVATLVLPSGHGGSAGLDPVATAPASSAPRTGDETTAPAAVPPRAPRRATTATPSSPPQRAGERPVGPRATTTEPAESAASAVPGPRRAQASRAEPMTRQHEPGGLFGGVSCDSDGLSPTTRRDWCGYVEGDAYNTDEDAFLSRLRVRICRDYRAGDTTLTFADGLQADFVVHDDKGHFVWRWSAGQPRSRDGETLAIDSGGCYVWTVTTERFARDDTLGWSLTGYVFAAELGEANNWTIRRSA